MEMGSPSGQAADAVESSELLSSLLESLEHPATVTTAIRRNAKRRNKDVLLMRLILIFDTLMHEQAKRDSC